MKRTAVTIALLVLALSAGGRADALVAVAGPGGTNLGFATRVVVQPVGQPLSFVNADTDPHNVTSAEYGPNTQPWCVDYLVNRCPVLWSRTTTVGTMPVTPVLGVENLVAGEIYNFFCTIHPAMTAMLVAV